MHEFIHVWDLKSKNPGVSSPNIYIFSQCRMWTIFSHTRIEVLISPSPADPGCGLCCAVMRSWCLRSRWASSPSRLHHFSPTADTAETWGRTSPSHPDPHTPVSSMTDASSPSNDGFFFFFFLTLCSWESFFPPHPWGEISQSNRQYWGGSSCHLVKENA